MLDTTLNNALFQRVFNTHLQLNDIFDFITDRVSISEYTDNFTEVEVLSELSILAEGKSPSDVFDKAALLECFCEESTTEDLQAVISSSALLPRNLFCLSEIIDDLTDDEVIKQVDARISDEDLMEIVKNRGLI